GRDILSRLRNVPEWHRSDDVLPQVRLGDDHGSCRRNVLHCHVLGLEPRPRRFSEETQDEERKRKRSGDDLFEPFLLERLQHVLRARVHKASDYLSVAPVPHRNCAIRRRIDTPGTSILPLLEPYLSGNEDLRGTAPTRIYKDRADGTRL